MARYDVTVKRYWGIEIEAETEKEAIEKAKKLLKPGEEVVSADKIDTK